MHLQITDELTNVNTNSPPCVATTHLPCKIGGNQRCYMRSTLDFRTAAFFLLLGSLLGHGPGRADAADHFISPSTGSIDCKTLGGGIKPGDTITLAGGPRGPLRISNCTGTTQNPIIIRNDTSGTGPTVIRRTSASSGGFVFTLQNVEHIVVDGTGGWKGSSGHCGSIRGELGTNCGIQVTRVVAEDTPTAFLKFLGLYRNYTVRGLRIDGRSWGRDDLGDGGAGIGVHQFSAEVSSDYPGYWRENILYEQNYVHNTRTECMYIGPNWNIDNPRIPLRNITIQDNYLHTCGRNAITIKSAVDGANIIQRNYAARTGLQNVDTGLGAIYGFTTSHLALRQNIVIESAGQCYGIDAQRIPDTFNGGYFHAENNLGVRCGLIGFSEKGYGISARKDSGSKVLENVVIDYNTIVDSEASGIRIGPVLDASSVSVRNNIITTPKTGEPITGGTQENNRTGSLGSMRFSDATRDEYRLTASSPAVNSGNLPSPAFDLVGTYRPQGGAPDQGAFELSSEPESEPVTPSEVHVE